MKAVILAGGRGTRLSEETTLKPKPLVEANGKPLIWHIMQNYSRQGINEFIVLSGYKGQLIREYFANYWLHQADVTFDLKTSNQEIHEIRGLPWKVTVTDSGVDTNTGGRIGRLSSVLNEEFLLTYGDGIADVDIKRLISTHHDNNNIVTLTAVKPPARFGAINLKNNQVLSFQEKPEGEGSWVNGGFFIVSPEVFKYLSGDNSSFEVDVLPALARDGKLGAHKHEGYWQPVDTIRDLQKLEEAIQIGKLPWMQV
jgi:glucose-1-phosphate cytidylyltransferase